MDMKPHIVIKKFETWCSLMPVALNTWCLNGYAVELWRIAHKEENSKWLQLTPSMRANSVSWDRPAEWPPPPATSMVEARMDNQGHSVDSDEVGLAKRRVL
eukprot:4176896-Amphidinium_carterae.1